jgi:competence protein ComGC
MQKGKGMPLENYNIVGYVIVVISIISLFLMWRVNNLTKNKMESKDAAALPDEALSHG